MMDRLLIFAHLLGSAIWVGGHVVVLFVVVPAAKRARSAEPVVTFERAFGKPAMVALAIQVVSGLLLTRRWIPSISEIFSNPTPSSHLILAKLCLLIASAAFGAHAAHRILPTITFETLPRFVRHAWIVMLLAILLVICGVGVRTGGLFT